MNRDHSAGRLELVLVALCAALLLGVACERGARELEHLAPLADVEREDPHPSSSAPAAPILVRIVPVEGVEDGD